MSTTLSQSGTTTTVCNHPELEAKLVTLIQESNRLYKMLQRCLASRERLQTQVTELLAELTKLREGQG